MKKIVLIILTLLAGIAGNAQNINQTHVGGNAYQYNLTDGINFPGYYLNEGGEMPESGYSYFWYTNTGHVSHQLSPVFKFHSPGPHSANLVLTPRKRPNDYGTNYKVNAPPHNSNNTIGTVQNNAIDQFPIYFDTEAKRHDTLYLIIPLSSCINPKIKDYKVMFSSNLLNNPQEVGKAVSDFSVNGNEITFSKDWTADFTYNDIAAIIKFTVTGNIGDQVWCEFFPPDRQCQDNSSAQSVISAGPYDPNYKESSLSEINLSENQQPRQSPTVVRYTIHFQNIGVGAADSITVLDNLPDYLTYVGNETSSHILNQFHSGNNLKWTIGSMTNETVFANLRGTNDPRQWPDPETRGWIAFDAEISVVNEFLSPKDTCYCLCNSATIYFEDLEPIVTKADIIAIGDSICFLPSASGKKNRWVDEICYDDSKFYNTVSINDIKKAMAKKLAISIYPNPTTSIIRIDDILLTSQNLTVWNQLGAQVEVKRLDSNTLDFSSLSAGFYYIRILTNKGSYSARVIKK